VECEGTLRITWDKRGGYSVLMFRIFLGNLYSSMHVVSHKVSAQIL